MTIPPIGFPSIPLPQSAQRPEAPRPMFSALAIASSGLSAQRVRMDVIAQIAPSYAPDPENRAG